MSARALSVWMYGSRIGELARQRRSLAFTYTPEALAEGIGRPLLSVAMPTQVRPFRGALPHAFFNGLLPEGEARHMIAYDFRVDADDAFALLEAIGRDCAGALVIAPAGETVLETGTPESISDAAVAERLRKLRFEPLGTDQRVRASLAGVQEKLLLARIGDGWGLPVDGAPSTHILKPAHPLLADSIANEALCMRVAHHLGVPVAPVEVRAFAGIRTLVVERYDRMSTQSGTIRVHQEDFCQATTTDVQRKYEELGGPSLLRCAETLRRWSAHAGQLELLLDYLALNVLIGNADAHAKNLSLLHEPAGGVRLAPLYDLTCTAWYPNVSTIAGMFVNSIRDISVVTPDDVIGEATSWGIPTSIAKARVDRLLAEAEQAIRRAALEVDPPGGLVDLLLARVSRALG